MITDRLSFAILFLILSSTLTGLSSLLRSLGKLQAKHLYRNHPRLFFFQHLLTPLYKHQQWMGLFYSLNISKLFLILAYAICSTSYLTAYYTKFLTGYTFILSAIFLIAIPYLLDLFASLISLAIPTFTFKIFSPIASTILVASAPFCFLRFRLLALMPKRTPLPFAEIRDEIPGIIRDSELMPYLDTNDQLLLTSIIAFKERIAKEIMVPRVDLFSLDIESTVAEAAIAFEDQGYSRIPVYRESVDQIEGVLLYKDLLKVLRKSEDEALNESIESLVKPVVYTPETKKISALLQEFRSKQGHLAIVVDEYGGTEGIVTLEDILEELVGEIADEYDLGEEEQYIALPSGAWVVDSKMSIGDIEQKLGIQIPESPEYETIGGYIFHKAGTIPSKGWRMHHDDFDIEVLSTTERSIEKVRITPLVSE